MPQRAEIPIPKLPPQTVCRLLNNLAYGEAVDPDAWGIPMLKARPADSPDPAVARRLVDAFYRAVEAGGSAGDGLWRDMGEAFHGPFLAALESRDMDAVAAMLAGMFYEPITAGLCRRERDPAAFQADTMARLIAVDVLESLGTALGVLRVHNPFSHDEGNPLVFDVAKTMG